MRSWWPERSEASSCLSFTASIFCRLAVVCCSTYSSPAAITPSHHTLLPIYSHGFPTIKPSPQTAPSNSSCNHHGAPPVKQRRIPSFPQQQIPNQRVCVITSSRIAAASARALPARAAHLSGWTHRLRPAAQAPALHLAQLTVHLT